MAPNRLLEEPTKQPQQPMKYRTQKINFNTTTSTRNCSNTLSFRSIPIGASGRMLRLLVFYVIYASVQFKVAAAVYALERIRGEISFHHGC